MSWRHGVVTFLVEHYGIDEKKAGELADTEQGKKDIQSAEDLQSRIYYPAGQIAHRAGIAHLEPCVACEKEDKYRQEQEDAEHAEGGY